ncbi:hypothetical protein [Endothiovibrio diazotrophicus]
MDLKTALDGWNGKDTATLASLYEEMAGDARLFSRLADSIERGGTVQIAATWLIKHHIEQGHAPSPAESRELLGRSEALDPWQSRLHLLQMIEHLSLDEVEQRPLEHFIRQALADRNKFVRAWAYHAFHHLARRFPAYRREALQLEEMALRDEPPAVKARVRRLRRLGFD